METNIMQLKQLPVIEEQLHIIKETINSKVERTLKLVCTEETVKTVKAVRAQLGKEFSEFENKRKDIKKAVLVPYENFEAVYKDCISNSFKNADSQLKAKIDSVENELKEKKRKEVEAYFNEYLASCHIDFVNFSKLNLNITLSASMKSLKEHVKNFIDKICDDLRLIDTQEHKNEILYEYKQSLNVSFAITTVVNRYKAIEAAKIAEEEQKTRNEEMNHVVKKVENAIEALTPPQEEETIFTVIFKVKGTKKQLKILKEFLNYGGYDYE